MLDLNLTNDFILAVCIYALGLVVPGSGNLLVMNVAMNRGIKSALLIAIGIIFGLIFWGVISVFAIGLILAAHPSYLFIFKIVVGLILLWLAYRTAQSAMDQSPKRLFKKSLSKNKSFSIFMKAAAIELTDLLSILLWLVIVGYAFSSDATLVDGLNLVVICGILGMILFCSYAIAFSSAVARRWYLNLRLWLEACFAIVLGYAGVRILAMQLDVSGYWPV